MKVLFISDVYSVGGAAKALGELVCELKKEGIEPIVCQSRRDDFSVFLEQHGIENFVDEHLGVMMAMNTISGESLLHRFCRYKKEQLKYLLAQKIALFIIKKQVDLSTIDLIHTNSARNDIGCLLHDKYNIPHIMHIREFGQEDFNCWVLKKKYYQYLNVQCDRILAVSNAVRESWIEKGVQKNKVCTLYDGVNLSKLKMKDVQTLKGTDLKMVMVGGVCDTKGQHIAIEAFHLLPKELKGKITLDIVGWFDPEYFEYLKRLLHDYDLCEYVRFLGTRDDVGELLQAYDVGLMCSKSEGFGRVTVEYMYVGLGILAANSGACPELIKHNYSGILFDRNEPQELMNGIVQFYNNREFLRMCAKNAHEEAATKYSSKRNAEEVMKVYKSVLDSTVE